MGIIYRWKNFLKDKVASKERLIGLEKNEAAVLAETGIHTSTDLWEIVGRNPSAGIDMLSKDTGISKARLIAILRLQGVLEAERRKGSWSSRNWLELGLLIGLALILVLFLVSRSRGVLTALPAPQGWLGPRQAQVIVSAPDGLPAFHLVDEGDVSLAPGLLQPGSFEEVSDVVNRFTLEAIPSGTTLLTSQVSTPINETTNMRILSLPITSHQLAIIQVGQPVYILLSQNRSSGKPVSLTKPIKVIILSESTEGEKSSIIVAGTESDLKILATGLGYSEIIILSVGN